MKISKEKVDIAMAQKSLNQTMLAESMKVSRTYLSSVLNGKNCRPDTVAKLSKALDVDVTEIIE